jgi:hypothetical protein
MKKILTLLAVLVVTAGFALNGQGRAATVKVPNATHLIKFPVVASDILDADGEVIYKIFDLGGKTKVQYYTIPVVLDSVDRPGLDGSELITVTLQESFDNVNWADLDTATYGATQADTTFNFQDLSTGTSAPLLRVKLDGADADSVNVSVTSVWGRFLDK